MDQGELYVEGFFSAFFLRSVFIKEMGRHYNLVFSFYKKKRNCNFILPEQCGGFVIRPAIYIFASGEMLMV